MPNNANEAAFTYRLALTYVRVVGSRSTGKPTVGGPSVECSAVVTTEVGADPLTAITTVLDPVKDGTAKATWTMLPDGRLAGTKVNTTVQRYAALGTALQVGTFVAAAALPFLVPGPAGVVASIGSLNLGRAASAAGSRAALSTTSAPQVFNPEGVAVAYRTEHADEFELLTDYRRALRQAQKEHGEAALTGSVGTLRIAARKLRLIRAELGVAEASYAAWVASQVTTEEYDERFRIDSLPTAAELDNWLGSLARGDKPWMATARALQTAVTIDLERAAKTAGRVADPPDFYQPAASHDEVCYRPPRMATLTVWTLSPENLSWTKKKAEVQRLLVAYPGNERWIPVEPRDKTSMLMGLGFDEKGALLKITNESVDADVQRSKDVGTLLESIGASGKAGLELREALLPPSLKEQADAADAAAKLAPPVPKDPEIQTLEKQLAREQLRAQLRIAQQLSDADSPPIVVQVTTPVKV